MSRLLSIVVTAVSALAFVTVADATQILEAGSNSATRIGGNWCC